MDNDKPTSITPKQEPITIHIPLWLVLVASILFAIIFFGIGRIFMHYPMNGGLI
jgi:hypothetical protein